MKTLSFLQSIRCRDAKSRSVSYLVNALNFGKISDSVSALFVSVGFNFSLRGKGYGGFILKICMNCM